MSSLCRRVKGHRESASYRVLFVPHQVIEDHIACYRVEYRGRSTHPLAAEKPGIPLNEIWISDLFRPCARCILFHELVETKHRARGLDPQALQEDG